MLSFCLLALPSFLTAVAQHSVAAGKSTKEVIAYIFPKESVLDPNSIAAQKLTRINYAFSNLQDGRIVEGFPSDPQNYAVLVALKKKNPALKIMTSVGGWTWSGNFSDMALTKESRGVFIQSVVLFLRKYHLDGLDIDWEYPGLVGNGNRFRPEDKQNYTLLLKELRQRFDSEEKRLHHHLYLSVATGASLEFLAHTEMDKVQHYLDTVNLMAYDYYEPTDDKIAAHHAPLFTNPADPKGISADRSVQAYEQAGVPARKIVLGVPFYGHVWGEVEEKDHGLYQPGTAVPNAYARYADVTTNMLDHGYSRYWDEVASVPYLYNPEKKIFVSYEDPQSLSAKCKYILDQKLGGVMFWEYSNDPSGVLLGTIHNQLQGKSTLKAGSQ